MLLHGVWFSYWNPESDGATGSCGPEDAAAAAHCRPLIISSTLHTALLHRDNAVGTDGHLGAEHLMKHTRFFCFFYTPLLLSQSLFAPTPTIPPSHIWLGSMQNRSAWELRE